MYLVVPVKITITYDTCISIFFSQLLRKGRKFSHSCFCIWNTFVCTRAELCKLLIYSLCILNFHIMFIRNLSVCFSLKYSIAEITDKKSSNLK